MSVARKAARGALWTVVASVAGRAIGVIGTLVMTRFLTPEVFGEIAGASILCATANCLTIWGFGQYTVVKGRGPDAAEVAWHATVFYVVLGVIALGLVALFGGPLTAMIEAPGAALYVPGLALALFIRRLGAMPERMLTMQMRFGPSALALAAGEIAYTLVAVSLAMLGLGGTSVVFANIVQSVVMVVIVVRAAGIRSWATPTALRLARVEDMLRFGVPLGIQNAAAFAARFWDKLAISHYLGPRATGTYSLAYNLADIPAIHVGEQIALVLLPSIAGLPPSRRAAALERATALLSLVLFPLAIGLGLIAHPLIAAILPRGEWQEVAPLLVVLASLSVFRPIGWVMSAYMEAEQKTSRLMFLELARLALILGGIAILSAFGTRAAAAAVGIAFAVTATIGVAIIAREGPSAQRLFAAFIRPLLACGVMVGIVWIVHRVLAGAGVEAPIIYLLAEIAIGALAYTVAALAFCRETSHDLLGVLRDALRRDRRVR